MNKVYLQKAMSPKIQRNIELLESNYGLIIL